MNLNIRKAEPGDAEQLFTLASQLAFSSDVEKPAFMTSFTTMLITDHLALAVAEENESVIGYVLGSHRLCFYANGRVAWVEELFVSEKHRGQSIGRKLMRYFENWAIANQCSGVALATRRAAPFYEAIGYEDSAKYFKKSL